MDLGAVLYRHSHLDNDTMPFEHSTVCPGQGIMMTRPACCFEHTALVLVSNAMRHTQLYCVVHCPAISLGATPECVLSEAWRTDHMSYGANSACCTMCS